MDPTSTRLAALLARLDGRAAGAWRVEGNALIQIAFVPAPDLPVGVAGGFAAATRSVDLGNLNLGIVRAAVTGRPAVSIAADLPADAGSGRWLRAFEAGRSVAVPIEVDGEVALVVSVALGLEPDDSTVAGLIAGAFSDTTAPSRD